MDIVNIGPSGFMLGFASLTPTRAELNENQDWLTNAFGTNSLAGRPSLRVNRLMQALPILNE
uniref:Uncharacterized protein n=1 Tax=Candidatus Kentrum eta TaxID=2126337 RepID=A0A450UN74_9GAMM|nr:MAG: hypothetical protein BECKH772A_GA0070896_1003027 [Candidatus Kentron sp. H]VFJ93983.1 MAG: hypothetical protein BECKH772B_GA0070898_1005318 [Candidatus Kentron sp. H]VFJ99142.1 MAG: hypothetical protein BECKH772C_GA0070978_100296 [Candidatus Kentron sp. H]